MRLLKPIPRQKATLPYLALAINVQNKRMTRPVFARCVLQLATRYFTATDGFLAIRFLSRRIERVFASYAHEPAR